MPSDRSQGFAVGTIVQDDDTVALVRIAAALERIAAVLEDVTDRGRVNVSGVVVTREDRP